MRCAAGETPVAEEAPRAEEAPGAEQAGRSTVGAVIVIERDRDGKRDALRSYKVVIDGRRAGSIRRGSHREFPVPPGSHVVQLHLDWCSSPTLPLTLATGERVLLRCGSGAGLDPLASITVARDRYIRLELANPA
jgi:hypothetical protein